jgi:hypothetical protein
MADALCQKAEQSQVYSESFATKLGRYTRRSFMLERGHGLSSPTVVELTWSFVLFQDLRIIP